MASARATRGEMEAELANAFTRFEKEQLGRGPLDARAHILGDLAVVRLRGILTPAEIRLAQNREGQILVKETRRQLFEISRPLIEELVSSVLGCHLVSLHTDMSTKTGERVVVLTLDQNLAEHWREQRMSG